MKNIFIFDIHNLLPYRRLYMAFGNAMAISYIPVAISIYLLITDSYKGLELFVVISLLALLIFLIVSAILIFVYLVITLAVKISKKYHSNPRWVRMIYLLSLYRILSFKNLKTHAFFNTDSIEIIEYIISISKKITPKINFNKLIKYIFLNFLAAILPFLVTFTYVFLTIFFVNSEYMPSSSWGGLLFLVLFLCTVVVFGIGFVKISIPLFKYSRQIVTRSASDVLTADDRAPILLLRSFEDDNLSFSDDDLGLQRFELLISKQVMWLGPFITIGRPGEKFSKQGARRAYFSDEEWQSAVKHWIKESSMIIYIPGFTNWVNWELSQILKLSALERTIIVLPNIDIDDSKNRLNRVQDSLKNTEWDVNIEELPLKELLTLCFTPNGDIVGFKQKRSLFHLNKLWTDDYANALVFSFGLSESVPNKTFEGTF